MKCIMRKNGNITRVSNAIAAIAVNRGKAKYVCKEAWKKQERPGYTPGEQPTTIPNNQKRRIKSIERESIHADRKRMTFCSEKFRNLKKELAEIKVDESDVEVK